MCKRQECGRAVTAVPAVWRARCVVKHLHMTRLIVQGEWFQLHTGRMTAPQHRFVVNEDKFIYFVNI